MVPDTRPCERCRRPIQMRGAGRRRPPRFCRRCQFAILANAAQGDLFKAQPVCVVCAADLSGSRSSRRTCSTGCRSYLSRLRSDPALTVMPLRAT